MIKHYAITKDKLTIPSWNFRYLNKYEYNGCTLRSLASITYDNEDDHERCSFESGQDAIKHFLHKYRTYMESEILHDSKSTIVVEYNLFEVVLDEDNDEVDRIWICCSKFKPLEPWFTVEVENDEGYDRNCAFELGPLLVWSIEKRFKTMTIECDTLKGTLFDSEKDSICSIKKLATKGYIDTETSERVIDFLKREEPTKLKLMRRDKGLTLEELSKKAEMPVGRINEYENGKRDVSMMRLFNAAKYAAALEVKIEDLLTD